MGVVLIGLLCVVFSFLGTFIIVYRKTDDGVMAFAGGIVGIFCGFGFPPFAICVCLGAIISLFSGND
jgi:hypothetical protein